MLSRCRRRIESLDEWTRNIVYIEEEKEISMENL